MTMTPDEILAVVQAFKDGKQIQFKDANNVWMVSVSPNWDFPRICYRVKPSEPKVIKYLCYEDGNGYLIFKRGDIHQPSLPRIPEFDMERTAVE